LRGDPRETVTPAPQKKPISPLCQARGPAEPPGASAVERLLRRRTGIPKNLNTETFMLKRMLFAAALSGLAIGVALPLQTTTADAAPGCREEAKVRYPGAGHFKERHAFRKWCRKQYRAHKAAMKSAA
jgi:hypothetical protein